jgi:DNA repair exonuclease SbcCD ATPase subunit
VNARVIEQAMIFALGFLVAGLAALAFAPAFWARANRLTRRQLEMQIPLSVQEILAERDQLRAEFAVERCRLDIRADQLANRHAEDLAQSGRLMTQITEMEEKLAAGDRALQESEAGAVRTRAELTSVQAELSSLHKAYYDAEGLLERKQSEFLDFVRMQEAMRMLAEARFAALAASDARVASLELRLGDVSRNLIEAEQKLTQKELHSRSLTDVIGGERHERELVQNKNARLQERLDLEARRTAQLTEELAALRRQHDDDLVQLRTLMVKLNVNESAIEDARRREKDVLAQRDLLVERQREAERAASEKYLHLRSEYAAVQGALDMARQRCSELEGKLARQTAGDQQGRPAAALSSEDSAALRQSIRDVGEAVVRMMRPNGEAPAAAPRLPVATMPKLVTPETSDTRVGKHEPATTS